jgi:hypothetical protein
MVFHPSIMGPVELPLPEPLRRPDERSAKDAGVRIVRLGFPHPSLAADSWSERSGR